MRRALPIDEIEVDATLGILVRPRVADFTNFDLIYRAAMGVSWHPQKHAFLAWEVQGMTPIWWFVQIVDAVRNELGRQLEVQPDTRWVNVSATERGQIASLMEGTLDISTLHSSSAV